MACHRPSIQKISSKNVILETFILIYEISHRVHSEVMEIPFKWIMLFGNNGGRWHAIGLSIRKISFKNAIFDYL
jgi:hypothetical protein